MKGGGATGPGHCRCSHSLVVLGNTSAAGRCCKQDVIQGPSPCCFGNIFEASCLSTLSHVTQHACPALSCCPAVHPLSSPQAAVAEFRAKVLAPFFADIASQTKYWGKQIKFDQATYIKQLEELAGKQLGYTINNLPPADAVSLFKVAFRTNAGGAGPNRGAAGIVDEAGKAAAQPNVQRVPTNKAPAAVQG